jgi:hypothetical protein
MHHQEEGEMRMSKAMGPGRTRSRVSSLARLPLAVAICMGVQSMAFAQDAPATQDTQGNDQATTPPAQKDQPRTLGTVTVNAQ